MNAWVNSIVGRIMRDEAGNILPLAAMGMLALATIVGSGVDLSRVYRAENRLQNACDAAVLAGRRAVASNGFDDAAEARADAFFATNFNQNAMQVEDMVFTASSDDGGNTVRGEASGTLHMALMQIVGIRTFELDVACSASMGVGNSDVVMVLDTTGSMGNDLSGSHLTRIEALRAAMKNFYDTLSGATGGTNARIRYGFVPYSSSVNVGRLLYDENPDYLVDNYTYQSRQAVFEIVNEAVFDHWDDPVESTDTGYDAYDYGDWDYYSYTKYRKSKDCSATLPGDTDWQNYGASTSSTRTYVNGAGQQVQVTTTTQRQRRTEYDCWKRSKNEYYQIERMVYRDSNNMRLLTSDPVYSQTESSVFDKWEYKPVTYDVSLYKTFAETTTLTASDADDKAVEEVSTWDGCIEERRTVPAANFSFNSAVGITPAAALDLDIDYQPDPWDDATKWAPMWPEVAYRRWNSSGYYTNSTTDYGARATSRCPTQARLLAEMDEAAFDAYADSLEAAGNTYLDLGMIWGARISSQDGIFQDNVNAEPANGGEVSRHIIFMTDGVMEPSYSVQSSYGIEIHDRRVTANGYTDQAGRHTSRFLAMCTAIKAKGIRIWVIAFTASLSDDLTTCASTTSSFVANDAAELNAAFQEIASQVGELRIVQ